MECGPEPVNRHTEPIYIRPTGFNELQFEKAKDWLARAKKFGYQMTITKFAEPEAAYQENPITKKRVPIFALQKVTFSEKGTDLFSIEFE